MKMSTYADALRSEIARSIDAVETDNHVPEYCLAAIVGMLDAAQLHNIYHPVHWTESDRKTLVQQLKWARAQYNKVVRERSDREIERLRDIVDKVVSVRC